MTDTSGGAPGHISYIGIDTTRSIPLDRLQPHNKGEIINADDGAHIVTPEGRWSYAASIPSQLFQAPAPPFLVTVNARVVRGEIGFGLLQPGGSLYLAERYKSAADSDAFVRFLIDTERPIGELMFRNTATDGPSHLVIHSIEVSSVSPMANVVPVGRDALTPSLLLCDQLELVGRDAKAILDVGSQKGHTTLEYLQNFPGAKVIAFEPDVDNFAAAQSLVVSHQTRCAIHPFAISDTDGTTEFHVNSHDGTHSLLEIGAVEYWADPASELRKVSVTTRTLDSFASEYGLGPIDIIKMDIQGAELAALKGARRLLQAAQIRLLCLEVEFQPLYKAQPLFWDIGAFLDSYGYSFFKLYEPVYHAHNGRLLCWADAIFLSPELTRI